MKLSKINRGLIITTITFMVIVIYLVSLAISQSTEKPKIKEVCGNYISKAISYKMLPEKYTTGKSQISQTELSEYIENMSKDLKAFYSNNEQTYKYVLARNKAELEDQAKGIGVIYGYKKNITNYKAFKFDGNTVTVTIEANATFDGPDFSSPANKRKSISAKTTDTITLLKTDGGWKVIYTDLQQPIENGYNEGMGRINRY